ncbi:retinol dehydrogenase 13 [Aplysia californica]|uniref:Retinol dehydrogenase 13 n=1 Tax=Aplysia californica TaxID=6500 RepID=A0ABM1A9R4_APLCA|nr:retinol dehydrogenase 13 [Aplysia californica]
MFSVSSIPYLYEDRVDILINNAGVLTGNKRPTEDGLERHMGVNHYGHFLLTQLLLDKLKASAPSRIIFVSAWVQFYWPMDFDHWPQNKKWFFKAYGQSKLANVLTARELSRRLKGTNVIVNTAHPGFIHTDIARDFPFYHSRIVQLLNSPFNFLLFRTPFLGAQPTLRLALDSSLANVTGKYFGFQNEENDPGWAGTDDEAAAKLWRISESVTKTGDM